MTRTRRALAALQSERGHVGPTVSALAAAAATVAAAVGIAVESHVLQIIGVSLFGLAIIGATQVPHLWLRKIYRRVDRITDESDPDRHEGFRLEL